VTATPWKSSKGLGKGKPRILGKGQAQHLGKGVSCAAQSFGTSRGWQNLGKGRRSFTSLCMLEFKDA